VEKGVEKYIFWWNTLLRDVENHFLRRGRGCRGEDGGKARPPEIRLRAGSCKETGSFVSLKANASLCVPGYHGLIPTVFS
jgi:hypothetical protein